MMGTGVCFVQLILIGDFTEPTSDRVDYEFENGQGRSEYSGTPELLLWAVGRKDESSQPPIH